MDFRWSLISNNIFCLFVNIQFHRCLLNLIRLRLSTAIYWLRIHFQFQIDLFGALVCCQFQTKWHPSKVKRRNFINNSEGNFRHRCYHHHIWRNKNCSRKRLNSDRDALTSGDHKQTKRFGCKWQITMTVMTQWMITQMSRLFQV